MDPVIVRGVSIGEGIPKICAPIVGRTEEEIIEAAGAMHGLPVDVAEWRADRFGSVLEEERVLEVLRGLRKILGEMPLLFTFRTLREGGEKDLDIEKYIELNRLAVESGYVDLIDVEIFTKEEAVRGLVEAAHACGVKVVGSNHDFYGTPPREEIIKRLWHMQELGTDICKIAVMPKTKQDVLTLLSATETMSRLYADRPVITMSMSGDGVISRICGEVFGSALTFGAAGKGSAPGQMDVNELWEVLTILHSSADGKK